MAILDDFIKGGLKLVGIGKRAAGKVDDVADEVLDLPEILRRSNVQNVAPTTSGIPRIVGTGLSPTPPVTATAKAPGLFGRTRQAYRGLPPIARGGIKLAGYGIPAVLAINAAGRFMGDDGADVASPLPQSVLDAFMTTPTSRTAAIEELLASPLFQQTYEQQAANLNAQQQSALDKYLGGYGKYSENQSKAILDEFNKIAADSAALAGATRQRGQDTASEMDRLYQDYADNAAALYAGEGLATPASEVSGMVPVSGEAATQAQTVPTYGQSIADYLGREANIAGTGYEALAASQRAQGAGMSQGMRDRYQLLDLEMRNAAAQEAANRLAGAQAQDIEFQRNLAMERARAQAADDTAASDRQRQGAIGWVQAGQLWESSNDGQRRDIEAALGIDRKNPAYKDKAARKLAVQEMVLQYPELLNVISLATGA
jgi:hypothetical protein